MFKRLGGSGGIPFFAFLNPQGEMIVNTIAPGSGNIGHPYQPKEVDWFMAMLAKAVPQMTSDERAILEKWLRAQKK